MCLVLDGLARPAAYRDWALQLRKHVNTGDNPANISIVIDAIPSYVAHSQSKEADKKRKDLAWGDGLFLNTKEKVRFDSFTFLTEWASQRLGKGKALYVSAMLKDQGYNHALAISHDEKNRHHSFDPNFGEFLIHEDCDDIFCETYIHLLQTKRKDEYAACWSYEVTA